MHSEGLFSVSSEFFEFAISLMEAHSRCRLPAVQSEHDAALQPTMCQLDVFLPILFFVFLLSRNVLSVQQ